MDEGFWIIVIAFSMIIFAGIGANILSSWVEQNELKIQAKIAEELEQGKLHEIGVLYAKTQNGECLYQVKVGSHTVYCVVDLDECPDRLLITKPVACYPNYRGENI